MHHQMEDLLEYHSPLFSHNQSNLQSEFAENGQKKCEQKLMKHKKEEDQTPDVDNRPVDKTHRKMESTFLYMTLKQNYRNENSTCAHRIHTTSLHIYDMLT